MIVERTEEGSVKKKERTEEGKKEVFKNFSPFFLNQLVLKKKKKKEKKKPNTGENIKIIQAVQNLIIEKKRKSWEKRKK